MVEHIELPHDFNARELKNARDPKFGAGAAIATACLIGLVGVVASNTNRKKNHTQESSVSSVANTYSSLTNTVQVTAKKGDTLSGLMVKYSGFLPKGKNLYTWQVDNDSVSDQLSAGKTYTIRTTNTLDNVAN